MVEVATMGQKSRWAESLEGLGGCNALSGNFKQAVRFFGAAEKMRERASFPMPLPDRPINERYLALCRDKMDKETF